MKKYKKICFWETFVPCSEARLKEIEDHLGVELPEGYRNLLRQIGGGEVDEDEATYVHVCGDYWANLGTIMGNVEGMGRHYSLSVKNILETFDIFNASEYEGGWGVPEGFLVFGFALGAPGEAFAISYRSDIFPSNSIVWMNLEARMVEPHEFIKIADTFDDFCENILTFEEQADIAGLETDIFD